MLLTATEKYGFSILLFFGKQITSKHPIKGNQYMLDLFTLSFN